MERTHWLRVRPMEGGRLCRESLNFYLRRAEGLAPKATGRICGHMMPCERLTAPDCRRRIYLNYTARGLLKALRFRAKSPVQKA
jgi:hypothetical protein